MLFNLGSIPAHAGEPAGRSPQFIDFGVYPRPRGGTLEIAVMLAMEAGLSPPTRGNRFCG